MKKLLVASIMISSLTLSASECIKTRAAFDIGSGSTKLKVAKVDTCTQKILEILEDTNRAVGYKQDLKESKNNTLSSEILSTGITALNELKNIALQHSPESITAVATSAFRTASNGALAAKKIEYKTGIKINIITQDKEAKIGFAGATALSKNDLKDVIVWDIGGGSMQITSYEGNNSYDIYKGKLAAVSFKNLLIEEAQGKDPKQIVSPNPINLQDAQTSSRDAKVVAKVTVPSSIKSKIKAQRTEIIGIGGVHYYAIMKALGLKNGYTKEDVDNFIKENLDKNDKELGGGKYVSTALSNFILVQGFMKALDIESIRVGKINMADGLLVMPQLAQTK